MRFTVIMDYEVSRALGRTVIINDYGLSVLMITEIMFGARKLQECSDGVLNEFFYFEFNVVESRPSKVGNNYYYSGVARTS